MKFKNLLLLVFITAITLKVTACNNSPLKSPNTSKNHDSSEVKSVDLAESNDDTIVVPTVISGSYLACSSDMTYIDNSTSAQIDCQIFGADHLPADTNGLWSGNIENPLPGESLETLDESFGVFNLTVADGNPINETLERTVLIFKGQVDGINEEINSRASQAIERGKFITKINSCPQNDVFIPGNLAYRIEDFCIMQYEAKNVDDLPVSQTESSTWVNISQNDAISRCQDIGLGYWTRICAR